MIRKEICQEKARQIAWRAVFNIHKRECPIFDQRGASTMTT
jgi:hypothetical protein